MSKAYKIAGLIDHTLLSPQAEEKQIDALCLEALEFGFHSVCVLPGRVAQCVQALSGRGPLVCTVVGFPLGGTTAAVKKYEAENALGLGARELDMVVNVGAVKDADLETLTADIQGVVDAAQSYKAVVKVILETCLLTRDQISLVCRTAVELGANFVKTSTGFGKGGANTADVALMRSCVGSSFGVKAAGGIRTLTDVEALVRAGANRIGTSSGAAIVGEFNNRQEASSGERL